MRITPISSVTGPTVCAADAVENGNRIAASDPARRRQSLFVIVERPLILTAGEIAVCVGGRSTIMLKRAIFMPVARAPRAWTITPDGSAVGLVTGMSIERGWWTR
jgi:hypothetical protein